MTRSKEGFLWTPNDSVKGLETNAVTQSSTSVSADYDVVVIGAGFAGLVAARDLSQNSRHKVLIVEGRDRIGGRTWTAQAFGEDFEMGGTWIHWNQPHVYRELFRYSLQNKLKTSAGTFATAKSYFKPSQSATHEIELNFVGETNEKIAAALFQIDGHTSRTLMPYPHTPNREPAPWQKYDRLSIRERLDQLSQFSETDRDIFESNVSSLGSAPGADIGLVELLRWYALGGHSMAQMFELCGVYKIGGGGMTELARRMLAEFKGDLLMESTVKKIEQTSDGNVSVNLEDGRQVRAKAVVNTIPLNCLTDIEFATPLSPLRQEAVQTGHINKGAKIHFKLAEVDEPWFATCSGRANNSPFCFAFSDHNGTKGERKDGTYCIGFGYNGYLGDKENSKEIIQAFQTCFQPDAEVKGYLTHDWMNDPFAKGVWSCWGPGSMTKYLEELQKPHGNVFFASADWADGWRGFVDGAIESGSRAAMDILNVLKTESVGR